MATKYRNYQTLIATSLASEHVISSVPFASCFIIILQVPLKGRPQSIWPTFLHPLHDPLWSEISGNGSGIQGTVSCTPQLPSIPHPSSFCSAKAAWALPPDQMQPTFCFTWHGHEVPLMNAAFSLDVERNSLGTFAELLVPTVRPCLKADGACM